VAHPGAPSRGGEVDVVASALGGYRTLALLPSSARLDGRDVLTLGRRIFVGSSARTDAAGARALQRIVAPFGYDVVPVGVTGCLHLKSAVTAIGEGAVLAKAGWLDLAPFDGIDVVPIPADDPWAANVLRVAGMGI